MSAESWLTFAQQIEEAGADALELNMYRLVTDVVQSSPGVEEQIRRIVSELKRCVRIPIAVKLLPFFTAFGHFAHQLDEAGADGLVLFNRFYEPDIDVRAIAPQPHIELSASGELPLRLHWASILHSRVRCSIAVTGGVATPTDGIKAILAGATAVQLVSAILRHGPAYLIAMRDGLIQWMDSKHLTLNAARGRVDGMRNMDLAERANYIRTLQSWNTPCDTADSAAVCPTTTT
jgi:dihydroorotate dehydrogenase (fumarate)